MRTDVWTDSRLCPTQDGAPFGHAAQKVGEREAKKVKKVSKEGKKKSVDN